jgi:CO/xanthine dehydrogenase Mo-binding subunit
MGQEITFKDGMVEQSNFHDFDAMRMWQAPQFEVAILENFHKMGGVGEVGTPPARRRSPTPSLRSTASASARFPSQER